MNKYKLTPEERFNLVMECRSSGLTDRQWCMEHGISRSTFYHWIAGFRKNGFPNIPEPRHQHDSRKSPKQEVVKLHVIPETDLKPSCCNCESPAEQLDQNAPISDPVASSFAPVAEIRSNGITLKISNNISPEIADILLKHMRGII